MTRNNHLSNPFSGIQGRFEVDYNKKQIKITAETGNIYYGIFEVNESGTRPTLKFEYQESSYPESFSSNTQTYILRDNGLIKANSNKSD